MKVNVIISMEYEIEIDDKFETMDLSECDDAWDNIPTSLAKELVLTAEDEIFGIHPELEEFEIEEIYSPEGNTMYKRGQWTIF